jgi:protein gp37
MGTKSNIEWTEQTWNPVTGCRKVSPGCKNCYAESLARRLKAMGAEGYKAGFDNITLIPERLLQPLRRKKPTIYFVNSMSDLFQDEVPFEFIDKVMDVISDTPQHTYQILTKRAERMKMYFDSRIVPDNAWLGVSVEDKKYGKPRIEVLRCIQAKTRFLSVEPLLEDLGLLILDDIDWVIVGGESGPNARPMKEGWALSVRDQCLQQNVDFFFKQWGSVGRDGLRRSKKENGRELDGRHWDMMPELTLA